ncbi:MAG: imidazolonepropionase [Armatimonadetes bacterium]|nr:imidazolonepropionase [Armatimonadota bacterium]
MRVADLIIVGNEVATCAPGSSPRPGSKMDDAGIIAEGAVAIQGDRIMAVGRAADILVDWVGDTLRFPGTCVVPGLVDSHAHPIFAGSRTHEFRMRARGASYQEIHESGGGILSTVRATRGASLEELARRTRLTLERMMAHGTTTVEAKSGYGLNLEHELRHLRILRQLGEDLPLEVVPTFLGGHTFPAEYRERPDDYVQEVIREMIPRVAQEGLAEFVDVFCEEGAFSLEQSRRILEAGRRAGLGLRIHAEEFQYLGGARMAAELGAASADHLLVLPESDFSALREAGTIPVVMPGTSFFLGKRYAPMRAMVDSDLPVALGTDFNAGSCMTESMPMAVSLAVLGGGLTPAEALLAATVNAAHSLGRGSSIGSIEVGKKADLLVLDLPSVEEWPYHFGVNLVRVVVKDGAVVNTILRSPIGAPL